jgi:hypothetical protein
MADEAQTTTTGGTEPAAAVPTDTRGRALAALDRLGWDGGGEGAETKVEEAPDPLAELAAKVEANLKKKPPPPSPAPAAFKADKAAFKSNPIAYLEALGLDVLETADTLFEYSSLRPEERQAKANAAELERFKADEKARKEREQAAREEQEGEAAELDYLAHLESAKEAYPRLMALAPDLRKRYSYEVAQMIVDAGEDAGPERLATLTERYVARLATTLGAGAQVHKASAVAGDRNKESAAGGAPQTITNHLAAESGSPVERDLSPEGRRAAAMRVAAAAGW